MADFSGHAEAFRELDTHVIALSSDGETDARETAGKIGGITVAFDLDAAETSRVIGCYTGTHDGAAHVQPAAFVLTGDGTVALAVYSSGKVGRLTAEDALTIASDLRKKREPLSEKGR